MENPINISTAFIRSKMDHEQHDEQQNRQVQRFELGCQRLGNINIHILMPVVIVLIQLVQ